MVVEILINFLFKILRNIQAIWFFINSRYVLNFLIFKAKYVFFIITVKYKKIHISSTIRHISSTTIEMTDDTS